MFRIFLAYCPANAGSEPRPMVASTSRRTMPCHPVQCQPNKATEHKTTEHNATQHNTKHGSCDALPCCFRRSDDLFLDAPRTLTRSLAALLSLRFSCFVDGSVPRFFLSWFHSNPCAALAVCTTGEARNSSSLATFNAAASCSTTRS